ncbi:MAG: M20 family metallopeptidase [Emergencia sp.]|jgi:amidohydrolase|uniref:M20/M25/M40 family metallo-hydrolase n=1 Tax=Senimuribacter intestinalis TaxID=2941507 RepID=UPI00203A6200|nr:M20/M25/M40 family metallo-hydrolase [Senimuribacter intestinalis]MCI9475100.1 M20 family metallopeptidase [Emergencia sp.]
MWSEKTHKKLLREGLAAFEEEAYALSDCMAANPELGLAEFESSKNIVALLEKYGIEVEYPFAGMATAFKASINPGGKKKAVFLAEYDALPEIGHGCGHCASGAASVLAILAVNAVKAQLGDVQIDIIGTPDEEWGGGKVIMQRQGIFDQYDFAAMVHMMGENQSAVQFYALDGMEFVFKGAPAHAAACPEKGRNALNAVRLLFESTDMMRQHVIKEAIISGYISDGGKAANIIPDKTRAVFITRAPRRHQLNDITSWVKDCAKAAAMATRTEVEILPAGEDYDDYFTGPLKEEVMDTCFHSLGLEVVRPENQGNGSSDIGNVATACAAFHPCMGIGKGLVPHTYEFARAMTTPAVHKAILNSAKFLLELTYRLFTDEELLDKIKKEHFSL